MPGLVDSSPKQYEYSDSVEPDTEQKYSSYWVANLFSGNLPYKCLISNPSTFIGIVQ